MIYYQKCCVYSFYLHRPCKILVPVLLTNYIVHDHDQIVCLYVHTEQASWATTPGMIGVQNVYIESVTFLCGHVVWRTDWRQTALCKVYANCCIAGMVSLERRRKWSSPKLSSVQNPVQISVHSPVHGPVQSPESSFCNDPRLSTFIRFRYQPIWRI